MLNCRGVLDACKTGYQLLHKKQRIFEYRDKPGKSSAFLLADSPSTKLNIRMQNSLGELVISADQKTKIFEYDYVHLYASEQPPIDRLENFFFYI